MSDRLKEFRTFRERMNERILAQDNLDIRRFFALDSRVYEEGALPIRTKELLGLVASLVLRCDDCISYHVIGCREAGVGGRRSSRPSPSGSSSEARSRSRICAARWPSWTSCPRGSDRSDRASTSSPASTRGSWRRCIGDCARSGAMRPCRSSSAAMDSPGRA